MDDSADSPLRRCTKCKEWFPATPEFFYYNSRSKIELDARCKACNPNGVPKGYRRCTKCKRVFPATPQFFHVRNDRPSGIRSECLECGRARANAYAVTHREQYRKNARRSYWYNPESSRAYHRAHNRKRRDMQIIYKRKYREEHRTEILAYAKQYSATHAEQQRAWWQKNKHLIRVYSNRYRAKKQAIAGTHTSAQIAEQLKRQRYRCYYAACGHARFKRVKKNGEWEYKYHVEHTFPITRIAGTDIPGNDISYLVLACPHCNQSKGKRFPWEWPQGGRLL